MIGKEIKQTTQEEEDELIRRSQSDSSAFRPLYDIYFKKIFLFVLHRIGDKAQTADITSQVFLKALISIHKFQFRGLPFSAWVFRIAINECNNFFRKNRHQRLVTIDDPSVDNLHEEIMANATVENLHEELPRILEKLSANELLLIELRFFEQRPFKEVADIVGLTESHAKIKVYRTLKKMKKLFLK